MAHVSRAPRLRRSERDLFIGVPDVGRELPVAADLAPYDDVFPDDFLRRLRLRIQADRADFTRRGAAQRQDANRPPLGLTPFLPRLPPEPLDPSSAPDHLLAPRAT